MRIPKKVGEYTIEACFFCRKRAETRNAEKTPVCAVHKGRLARGLKCSCGLEVEPKQGAYGTFFICLGCGPMSPKKIKEINGLG